MAADYFDYATGTNSLPGNTLPDPGNHVNFYDNDTGTGYGPYYRTEAGAFTNSASPYGTFDQNGNVFEWSETSVLSSWRVVHGGSFNTYAEFLAASSRQLDPSVFEWDNVGFRVANSAPSIPGDYSSNGIVDAADYNIWRDHLGETFALQNRDSANSGPISTADYTVWQTNFGNHAGSGAGAAIPEPSTAALLVIGCVVGLVARLR